MRPIWKFGRLPLKIATKDGFEFPAHNCFSTQAATQSTTYRRLCFLYQDEYSRMVDWIRNPVPFARAHGLKYFEFEGTERAIAVNPDCTALYRSGPVTVYALPQ